MALGHLDDLGQHADVAVHRVDALHHHQLLAPHAGELALQVQGVVVAEEDGLGLGEDGAVHDGGVRVLVAEDVCRPARMMRGDEADVGAVAGREQDRRFLVLEGGHRPGQLVVDVEGAARGSASRRRPGRTCCVASMAASLTSVAVGDAEVVVGREVDEVLDLAGLAVADRDPGAGRGLQRLGVEVVAVGQRLLVPLAERARAGSAGRRPPRSRSCCSRSRRTLCGPCRSPSALPFGPRPYALPGRPASSRRTRYTHADCPLSRNILSARPLAAKGCSFVIVL